MAQVNAKEVLKNLQDNIEKVIIGKTESVRLVLTALMAKGHVLIEDVPGVGKTTLVSSLAKSLSLSYKRIQFTPDVLPSDITGFSMYNFKTGQLEFKPGMIMSQIILADEINRTSPRTQSSLLEVMEEHQVTVDGITYKVPQPFMIMATQNPVEYVGTYPLPEAQLDRFFVRVSLGYPSQYQEVEILNRYQKENPLETLEPVATVEDIMALQKEVLDITVTENIKKYITSLVGRTRTDKDLMLGASPRGSIFLMRAAQAHALINGRSSVTPDDVQAMISPVLAHRLMLKPEARLRNVSADDILKAVINDIYPPVIDDEQEEYE